MNGTIGAALAAAGRGARRAAVLLAAVAAACSSSAPPATVTPPPKALRSLTVSPAPTFLATGDTLRLTAIGHYDDGSSKDLTAAVTWSSSNPVAAAVDAGGVVAAAGQGTTTVTATDAATGLAGTAAVTSRPVVSIAYGSAALPRAARVGLAKALVRVTGLTPGAFYRASLGALDDDVDLELFSDLSLEPGASLCSSQEVGTAPEACAAPANAAGELILAVDGQWTENGAGFTVDAAPEPPVAVKATVAYPGQLPLSGAVGTEEAFYRVTGLAPGARYQARLSHLTDDADLEVFGDRHAFASACSSFLSGTVDDACTAVANGDGELLVEVDGSSTASGSAFELAVVAAP